MEIARTIGLEDISTPLLNHIGSRDAALWVMESFAIEAGSASLAEVARLPWRLVLSESADPDFIATLEKNEDPSEALVRRRGFVQLVDTNPADVQLPPRNLPIYLLNGRIRSSASGLAAMTRRLTMLDALRQSGVKELVVLAGRGDAIPPQLDDLWKDGLRSLVTIVSDSPNVAAEVETWRSTHQAGEAAAYIAPDYAVGRRG